MASASYSVKVYIYDVSRGMAKAMSQTFLGRQLEGIWHTGIVVYGQEYFYGGMGGIESCPPGGTIMGRPDTIHDLGQTQVPHDMFVDYLRDLAQSVFRPEAYHLLEHNCNSFSSDVAQFLTGNDITGLPAEVLSTPFGQMIKPFIDSMSVQPSGGHAMFPEGQTGKTSHGGPASNVTQSQTTLKPVVAPSQTMPKPGVAKSSPKSAVTSGGKDVKVPHVFRDEVPEEASWEDCGLTSAERDLVRECYEYVSQTESSWALGRGHMTLLFRLALDGRQGAGCALTLLQRLVLIEDVAQLLQHDPKTKQALVKVLQKFEFFTESVQCDVAKMVTNCCSQCSTTSCIFTNVEEPQLPGLASDLCVICLLADNPRLSCGAALAYNVGLLTVPDDKQLELGSALLNCLDDKQLDEQTAFHILAALCNLMQENLEVRGLSTVLCIDMDIFKNLSDRVAALSASFTSLQLLG